MKMKRFNLIPLALTTLMLGACSSEDGLNLGGGNSVAQGEKGYISFSLNLPTVKSTANRANDDFDDGTSQEYNVEDAVLLLFNGTSEANAKFAGAYELTLGNQEFPGGNVTTSYKIVEEVSKPTSASDKIYALVVVNGKASGILTGSDDQWSVKGNQLSSGTTTYTELAQYALANTDLGTIANATGKGCFLMTNAPLYTNPGGTKNPTGGSVITLTEINPNKIYPTEAEAQNNSAGDVYVERAVAKVTVTANATEGDLTSNSSISYEIKGWALDVTNTTSNLVRQVDDSWWTLNYNNDYRFVGSSPVSADGLYRTYWGIDPNYDKAGSFVTLAKNTVDPMSLKAVNASDYCLENTFNLSQMNENQTTRVFVAAALDVNKDGTYNDFYVFDNEKSTILDKDGITAKVKSAYLSNPTVVETVKANLKGGETFDETCIDVTFDNKIDNGGFSKVLEVTVNATGQDKFENETVPTDLQADNNQGIIDAINAAHKIACYKGRLSYYDAKIQHFGDQTPWTSGSYGSNNNAYLGRYGVLRNNWYSINVTGIKEIGDPEVPEIYNTPDDPEESWISVSINILSWAKRSQSVDL